MDSLVTPDIEFDAVPGRVTLPSIRMVLAEELSSCEAVFSSKPPHPPRSNKNIMRMGSRKKDTGQYNKKHVKLLFFVFFGRKKILSSARFAAVLFAASICSILQSFDFSSLVSIFELWLPVVFSYARIGNYGCS